MNSTLSPYYKAINEGNLQHCNIYCTALNGTQLVLTEADLKQGGFRYDARSTSGETIELGAAIAAQLTLTTDNTNTIAGFPWYGAKVVAQVGIETGGTIVYGNIGEFIVDEADLKYDIWTITALDNLVRLDKLLTEANWNTINGATHTAVSLARTACVACGARFGTVHANAANTAVTLPTIPAREDTTWRNVLQWCAAFTCSVAYCDENGDVCLGWYDDSIVESDDITIDLERRYKSTTAVQDVAVTGVNVVVKTANHEEKEYVYPNGGGDYQLTIADNPLFTESNAATTVAAIGGKVRNHLTYCPFDAQTVPYFYLQPLDTCYVYVVDAGGYTVPSFVTHITFTLNGSMSVEGVGKSVQSKSYQNGTAFTAQQALIIDTVKDQITNYIDEHDNAVERLNTLMANAMGLQATTINGIWYAYYAPNNNGIENATIIYTLTNQGFAWTRDWNGGSPTWNYGITAEGNAILNQLDVTGVTVANSSSDFSTEITPSGWSLKSKGVPLMTASVATGEGILTLQKTIVGDYIKIGKARLYGTTNGMDIVIED